MEIGDAFVLRNPKIERGHLWIVISKPQDDPLNIVIVNLTSEAECKDFSCTLGTEDHPWIKYSTLVSYRDAKCVPVSTLDALITSGDLISKESATNDLIGKLLRGAEVTGRLPIKCQKVLIAQDLIVI